MTGKELSEALDDIVEDLAWSVQGRWVAHGSPGSYVTFDWKVDMGPSGRASGTASTMRKAVRQSRRACRTLTRTSRMMKP
jgi:hypothetical protein